MRVLQILRLVLVLVGCAVAVAACGSSSQPHVTVDLGTSPQGVKYSDCMRERGVPEFPDLNANGSVSLPPTINPQSPAFQSAEGACASLRPQGSPPPPITLAQQDSFTANAKCIRTHGIPDFPDPSFGPGGRGVGIIFPPGAPRPTSAALMLADAKCAHVGSRLPLRGVAPG
jgi:hypothetical protein